VRIFTAKRLIFQAFQKPMGFDFFLGSVDVAAQLEGIELLVQLAQLGLDWLGDRLRFLRFCGEGFRV